LSYSQLNPGRPCIVPSSSLKTISDPCPCTEQDFGCAPNFKRSSNGQCSLPPGVLDPYQPKDCQKSYKAHPYVKFPLNKCVIPNSGKDWSKEEVDISCGLATTPTISVTYFKEELIDYFYFLESDVSLMKFFFLSIFFKGFISIFSCF